MIIIIALHTKATPFLPLQVMYTPDSSMTYTTLGGATAPPSNKV
jgi:hypothetical protein